MPSHVTCLSIFFPLLTDQDAAMYVRLKASGQLMQYDVHASGVTGSEHVSLLFHY